MNASRLKAFRPFPAVCATAVACSLALMNLQPRITWFQGRVVWDLVQYEDFPHGWPYVYMFRDSEIAGADMGGMYHGVWPFQKNPGPIRHFRFRALVGNATIALLISLATAVSVNSFPGLRAASIRFNLLTALLTLTCIGGVFALDRLLPGFIALACVSASHCVVLLAIALIFAATASWGFRWFVERPNAA